MKTGVTPYGKMTASLQQECHPQALGPVKVEEKIFTIFGGFLEHIRNQDHKNVGQRTLIRHVTHKMTLSNSVMEDYYKSTPD